MKTKNLLNEYSGRNHIWVLYKRDGLKEEQTGGDVIIFIQKYKKDVMSYKLLATYHNTPYWINPKCLCN